MMMLAGLLLVSSLFWFAFAIGFVGDCIGFSYFNLSAEAT